MNTQEAKLVLEAALLTGRAATLALEMRHMFDDEINADTLRVLLDELRTDWSRPRCGTGGAGLGLALPELCRHAPYLDAPESGKGPKYSRAVLETLAIIAYRQPVTRGDIEEIRGRDGLQPRGSRRSRSAAGSRLSATARRRAVPRCSRRREPSLTTSACARLRNFRS